MRVLDGPLAPIPCACRTQYQACEDCDEATCQVRHMMLEVRQAIAEVLDNRSLAEMRDAANDDVLPTSSTRSSDFPLACGSVCRARRALYAALALRMGGRR